MTVSRQRTDYSRPLFRPSANTNSPPLWTPARIIGLGQFRALAHITTTPPDRSPVRSESVARPVRPVPVAINRQGDDGVDQTADEALRGLLDAIAHEVQARTASICDNIAVEFSGRIRLARTTLPRDHVAAAVAALKQAKREAVKFVRESAASEIKGRQKGARMMFKKTIYNFCRSLNLIHIID